jgi:hypothetical protein
MNLMATLDWSSSRPQVRNMYFSPRSVTFSLVEAGVIMTMSTSARASEAGMVALEQ